MNLLNWLTIFFSSARSELLPPVHRLACVCSLQCVNQCPNTRIQLEITVSLHLQKFDQNGPHQGPLLDGVLLQCTAHPGHTDLLHFRGHCSALSESYINAESHKRVFANDKDVGNGVPSDQF